MLNKTILMGQLTRTPELRHTSNGTAVSSFSLAIERDYKDSESGERITDFFDVVAWRQTAEFVSKYFSKGQMMAVDGRLQTRTWLDNEGGTRRAIEVVADNIYFAGSSPDMAMRTPPEDHRVAP